MASSNLLLYYNWIRGSMLLSFGVFAQVVGPRNAMRIAGFRLGDLTQTVDDKRNPTTLQSPAWLWVDKLSAAITGRDVGFAVMHFAAASKGDLFSGAGGRRRDGDGNPWDSPRDPRGHGLLCADPLCRHGGRCLVDVRCLILWICCENNRTFFWQGRTDCGRPKLSLGKQ